jgi:hypothetical protein
MADARTERRARFGVEAYDVVAGKILARRLNLLLAINHNDTSIEARCGKQRHTVIIYG